MRNRDMPAKPVTGAMHFKCGNLPCEGLTKLEYAAIQIFSGACADPEFGDYKSIIFAVNRANALFDELEKQEQE